MSDFAGSINIGESLSANLQSHQTSVDSALRDLQEADIINRIWQHDHTVWKPEPIEISNRLDWLHSPEEMAGSLNEIHAFVDEIKRIGYTKAVLLGMGGSSLAPEVFRFTFGVSPGYLDLSVLDSTDPGAVLAVEQELDLDKTLFIVSTKSGGTVETLSLFKYFYTRVTKSASDNAGGHFIAITDPGSRLVDLAETYSFRKTFLNNANIGGRYSALSYFGLVPAALVGVDLRKLLDTALKMAKACSASGSENPAVFLGVTLGELAGAGTDKLTLIASPEMVHFGAWVEQLIAESTGKEGRGILPIDGEEFGKIENYGNDRLFVQLSLEHHKSEENVINEITDAGHPVVRIALKDDPYELGGQFFLWELATAVAGWRLGINPFDQPDVESAKVSARNMVAAYQHDGQLPDAEPNLNLDGMKVYTDYGGSTPGQALIEFLQQAGSGKASEAEQDYIAFQAYVQPSPETDAALSALRTRLRDRFRLATTVGYGPRFLHSTGQLHKGDAGHGLFIQITAEDPHDVAIPDEAGKEESSMTFGVLKLAQALGDRQALLDAGRKVIRFHLRDVHAGLRLLQDAL